MNGSLLNEQGKKNLINGWLSERRSPVGGEFQASEEVDFCWPGTEKDLFSVPGAAAWHMGLPFRVKAVAFTASFDP